MAEPMVSVVVPIYKVERYIKICIDSILAQTFTNFEIILVDDASPDKSADICQKLYGGNEKVRLIRHEKNLGLGPARNTGMKHARGKYIYFVDSDDFILPNALEKLFTAAEKNNAQIVRTAGYYKLTQDEPAPIRDEDLKLIWAGYNDEGFIKNDLFFRLDYLWKKMGLNPAAWCGFYRRDFLEKNQIQFVSMISEDVPFHLVTLGLAKRYYILHKALYVYRIRENSIMTAKNVDRLFKTIQGMIAGSIYTAKFLDQLPDTEKYKIWREELLRGFFDTFFIAQHSLPFYRDLKISPEMNELIKNALLPTFGNVEPFVKFFFNGYHLYRRQSEILIQQRNQVVNQLVALQQRNQQINKLFSSFIREQNALLKLMSELKADGKRIFLMGTPRHGNLGDHAIVLGELRILQNYFPEHKIIEVLDDFLRRELGELLFKLGFENLIRHDDIIFCPGGGNLGNLWIEAEKVRRTLIEKFPQNKIVIFPQSIHFTDDDAGRRELAVSKKIYNAHKDLHLMTRDENSFNFARKNFSSVQNYLLPDSVTVLEGLLDDVDVEREGVLFVLRNDKEKFRNDEKISRLKDYLTAKKIPFAVTDTVLGGNVTTADREQKVREMLMKFRRSKLVITDRFHGVVFSFVTRTPVIAFKSLDTKISSGIRWFKNLPTIFYAQERDWEDVGNFIAAQIFATEEKNFVSLTVKADTDAEKFFTRALNQIFPARQKISP